MGACFAKKPYIKNNFKEVKEILSLFFGIHWPLYSFLNEVAGPLSVYVCALNRTFLFVG